MCSTSAGADRSRGGLMCSFGKQETSAYRKEGVWCRSLVIQDLFRARFRGYEMCAISARSRFMKIWQAVSRQGRPPECPCSPAPHSCARMISATESVNFRHASMCMQTESF